MHQYKVYVSNLQGTWKSLKVRSSKLSIFAGNLPIKQVSALWAMNVLTRLVIMITLGLESL